MFKPRSIYHAWISLCLAAILAGAVTWSGGAAAPARAAAALPPGQGTGGSAPQAASPAVTLPTGLPASGAPGGAAVPASQEAGLAPQGGGTHTFGAQFLHASTTGNSSGFVTYLDHLLLNQQPAAMFIATSHDKPNGLSYNGSAAALGAYYDPIGQRWSVMYENFAMLAGMTFNVFVPPTGWIFAHTATVGNTTEDLTLIDNPLINGHPEAIIFATHNYSLSAGGAGAYHNHYTGVYYDSISSKWGVYNQDQAGMPSGIVFNVAVAGPNDIAFTHIAGAGNISGAYTILDAAGLNGHPNALLTVTPIYKTAYFNLPYYVRYETALGRWVIVSPPGPFPVGAAFNVLVTPPVSGAFVHVVSAQNIHPTSANFTALNHPSLNGNPDALVTITHVLNAAQNYEHWVYQTHPTGVVYLADSFHPEGRWYIYTTDAAPLVEWQAYNVYFTSQQSNATSVENAGSGTTTMALNLPQLNGNTAAAAQLTHNWNPDNHNPLVGYSFPYPVGFRYTSGSWMISRPSGPNLPQHLSYNLFVPQANAFTHIATAGNISSAITIIDNALTNNRPWAMVFVTPNGSPGGVNKLVNEIPIGMYYSSGHWAVLNESLVSMTADTAYNIFVVPTYQIYAPMLRR